MVYLIGFIGDDFPLSSGGFFSIHGEDNKYFMASIILDW